MYTMVRMKSTFRRLLKELLPFKSNVIWVAVCGLVMSLCMGQVAVSFKTLIDSMQDGSREKIFQSALVIFALTVAAAISRYYHLYLMNITSEYLVQNLRVKLQKKFMSLSLTFHNRYSSGSGGLLSRILNDINWIQQGLRLVADLFREPVLLVFLIGWLFYLNWKLTLSIIIVLPVLLQVLRRLAKSVNKYSHRGQQGLERVSATVKETLDGVRVIQSFNLEEDMEKRFRGEFVDYIAARKKIHSRMEIAGPVSEVIATFMGLGILLYMAFEISQGRATYGDFASYVAALLMINKPLKTMQDAWVRLQETLVSAHRVFELIDEQSEVPQNGLNVEFPANWQTIEFRNVSFKYEQTEVLKNVSFKVHRGETVALVGASGSGKSTLMNLLERFYDPTEGSVFIDNVNLRDISLKSLRHHIALVTQDVYLFRDTVENNIWSGDFSKNKSGVQKASQSANSHDFILKTEGAYQAKVGERGNSFSGGEKQRISIARAIFKDAPILILDEATSALDSASEHEVQKGLNQLMVGKTSLVIAHRLSTVANADRIIVMKNGSIVEQGSPQELLSQQGEFYTLHRMQFKD